MVALEQEKTTKVLEFLELKDVLCSDKFYKTYYFYLTWQSIYDKMKLHKLVDYFIEGIPDHESLMTLIDNNSQWNNSLSNPVHQLLIFDDLLCDICLLYTSPSQRDQRGSRMPSSA